MADKYYEKMSFDEVEDAIRDGVIFDAKTLSAWLMYKLSA